MSNLYTMRLGVKGCESSLNTLKSDLLKHCSAITAPATAPAEYRVDLGRWYPSRQDWVEQPMPWWLELRDRTSELLPVEDGELHASAMGMGGPPLHFLDGLRELYPDLELSACTIDLSNYVGEDWRCSPEGTFCVEEVASCYEGEEVWYWKKDGRLMIDDGKPVAKELLEFFGTRFVLVNGVPVSFALDAAKEHVQKQIEQGRADLAILIEGKSPLDGRDGAFAESHPAREPDNGDFFGALNRMHRTQSGSKETS
jgi:hypothetical protein